MQKKEVCVCGGGGIVGYFDLINTLKLGKEVLSDTWHSFPKWGDGKLRKKKTFPNLRILFDREGMLKEFNFDLEFAFYYIIKWADSHVAARLHVSVLSYGSAC